MIRTRRSSYLTWTDIIVGAIEVLGCEAVAEGH